MIQFDIQIFVNKLHDRYRNIVFPNFSERMCGPFLGEAVPPPNRKCKIFVGLLIGMFCIQILIAAGAFAVVDIPNGIFSVLFLFLLFMGWRYLQYTTLMMYLICSIVLYVMALVYVLGIVQNGTNICPDLKNCAKFALNIAFFVYYFAASILTFFIYREFKAVAFEKNPQLARFFPPQQQRKAAQNPSQNHLFTLGNFAPTYGPAGAREQPLPTPQLHVINPQNQAQPMLYQPVNPPTLTNQVVGGHLPPSQAQRPMSNKSIVHQNTLPNQTTTMPTTMPNQTVLPGQPERSSSNPNSNNSIFSGNSFRLPWTQASQNQIKPPSQKALPQTHPVSPSTSQKDFKPFKGKGVTLG